MFEEVSAEVKATHGDNAYALCFGVAFDSALSSMRSGRDQCPVTVCCLNITDVPFDLIGYAPIHAPCSLKE